MKEHFGLYLILTDPLAGYETCAQAAVETGIRYLQLRMKDAALNEVITMGRKIKQITRDSTTRFIVNDSLEAAIGCDADGIHLGQDDLDIPEARQRWNAPDKLFGLSTHSMEQAERALQLSPDYIGIGPVYPTRTKTDTDPVLGPAEAGRIAAEIPLTSVVIGGINPENLPDTLRAGAQNYCVVSAVNHSENPVKAIKHLQEIWKSHSF